MPTVAYKTLSEQLNQTKANDWPVVTLICGEELLCQKAYTAILDTLLPEEERAMGLEIFDGSEAPIDAALSSINTYALLSGSKVVVIRDARLFYSNKSRKRLQEKMEQTGKNGELKKASRPFLNLMALSGLTYEDLDTPALRSQLMEDTDGQPVEWFSQLIDYCKTNRLVIPEAQEDADRLLFAMEKGFPDGHRLLITTDIVDRRKALYKAIDKNGLVVNCTVPKGESRADRLAQDAVSKETLDEMLAASGKIISMDGRRRLMDWTGFDLRTLTANLGKLIDYVGERKKITDEDVTTVLRRSRKDPIFEFTNAVAQKDLPAALFTMKNLLDDGMHPLQLLSAVANQVRRLLVAKDFLVRDKGKNWRKEMSFPVFKTGPFQAVRGEDENFSSRMQTWDAAMNLPGKGKKKKKAPTTDLLLVKNPKSPFPVYQTLKKAELFSFNELTFAMIHLSEVDRLLKSTGQSPVLLLEKFLIEFCKKGRAKWDS